MTEFELDGHEYRLGKLPAFAQFHVSRKIAPLLPPLLPLIAGIAAGGKADLLERSEILQPFTDSLAQLPDETAEYVLSTCLSVVRRKQGDNWIAVWNVGAKAAMFEDLTDMSKLLPLVVRVIKETLAPFMAGLLTSQQTENTAP